MVRNKLIKLFFITWLHLSNNYSKFKSKYLLLSWLIDIIYVKVIATYVRSLMWLLTQIWVLSIYLGGSMFMYYIVVKSKSITVKMAKIFVSCNKLKQLILLLNLDSNFNLFWSRPILKPFFSFYLCRYLLVSISIFYSLISFSLM